MALDDEKAIGFAYGYVLNEPDGRKTYYLHTIDIMAGYQNLGYGTELVRFVYEHSKSLGCRKMFLMTNTGNVSACINAAADVVMYKWTMGTGLVVQNNDPLTPSPELIAYRFF